MAWFKKKDTEQRADETISTPIDCDVLLQAILGRSTITKTEALAIPSVRSCINFVGDAVSMLPIKLYEELDGKTREVKDDPRLRLLNNETGDTLDAVQYWRALVSDYFLGKGGYAYINKIRNQVASLHYVDEINIAINKNADPIFKDYNILVNGGTYKPFEFIKLLRNSKDGAVGIPITTENSLVLSVSYCTLLYEENLVKKGGNKKGFLKSETKLTDVAVLELRAAWKRLYGNDSENIVVLNKGIEFQEASNTSVEMQLNENKESNAGEICKLFNIPVNIIKGTASPEEYKNGFKSGVLPVLRVIECALKRDLLLEKEKRSFYYAFDTKEMLKGDIKERFDAYKIGIDGNFLGIDEARNWENLEPLGIDWLKLGLDCVLYNPKTGEIYTPNTNESQNMMNLKKQKKERR